MQSNCTISDGNEYAYAIIGLFVFSIAYNFLVDWLEQKGWERGITSLLVAVGSAVTLLPIIWLAGWQLFIDIIGLFAASGVVMIGGSLYRYFRERDEEIKEFRNTAQQLNEDKSR